MSPIRTLTVFLPLAWLLLAPPASFAQSDSSELRAAVTVTGVRAHQAALQAIADGNGGTRLAGTPGYTASATYVADQLSTAGYSVVLEPFSFEYFEELVPAEFSQLAPVAASYPYSDPTGFYTFTYSGSGDVTAAVEAVDVQVPPGAVANSSTSGCEASDFAGFTAGSIALLQRGSCTFALKVQNAEAAGASAVIIFNEGQPGREEAIGGTLGEVGTSIPAVSTSYAIGADLAAGGAFARVFVDAISEVRSSSNVIADAPGGSDTRLVIAGTHLDSPASGPGIQDNGSGSAALLEIALQFAGLGIVPENRLRFVWWGGEEVSSDGGSATHISGLTPAELAAALYLDFDMLGSPNFVRFVLDGDGSSASFTLPPGSAEIEQVFFDYFASQSLPASELIQIATGASGNFAASGVPVGMLFAGADGIKTAAEAATYGGIAGVPYDPCHNLACDTFDNVSLQVLDELSDAAAHAILHFAGVLEADLSISKTDGETAILPGDSLTYTIVASNAGPSAVPDALVTDSFQLPLTDCSWTAVASGGASGAMSGIGDINEVISLPAGASMTYTASCGTLGTVGAITNTATIASATVPDPDAGNNSGVDDDTFLNGIRGVPTLDSWALWLLLGLMAMIGLVRMRSAG
ncbi:M20/M25/M40 family metallo-hydrolase [Wenzhouxiangella marina]|uniref:Aminopeptidase Y n=1 Tax=Wenzhouxiangella marina TaxID=1579979 RepID=A0A0K0XYB2_9GAMM|nr:M20/M25/M40 family metallo-hydrolase [Wenzhouxiangella marina]AKS42660.1 Aminopeptidase Y [Wenzhouxiangella marina]MBB6088652.1 putative repeat protein (TIGR01451 family) [Wenzhouxiangella marina]